jgi:endonuclease/exonuclease/phosphatase family metal-dependent hydrolase
VPRIQRISGPRRGARTRLLCAVAAVLLLVPASSVRPGPVPSPATFVVLQMNLCNSGLARSCYSSGRAVGEAAEKLRRHAADLVAVQEVCSGDLSGPGGLTRAMADRRGGPVSVAFTPAVDRDTDDSYRCTNGEPFGVALIHRGAGGQVHRARYASQDSTDELRVWMCTTVIDRRLTGCTTHLSTDRAVAVRQCRELMSVLGSPWVLPDVVVAGDLNLTSRPADPHGVGECAPAGYGRRSDGAVQHILFTPTVRSVGGGAEPMRWTDHPLLYATVRLR